jgi:hypothetical protein
MSASVTPITADGAPSSTTAEKILLKAATLVSGDRQKTHGDKAENHQHIADLWTAYLATKYGFTAFLTPLDAALMMNQLKVARTMTGAHNPDDYVDGAGYMGVAGEIAEV